MTNIAKTEKPVRRGRIGRIVAIMVACGVVGGLIWWYLPANAPRRYERMSMLELSQMLDRNPKDGLAAKTLAMRLASEGDSGMGEPALVTAVTLNPDDPELATALGDLWMAKGRYPEAFQLLKSVAMRFPHYLRGRAELGSLYMKKGSYQHAAEEYEAVVAGDRSADGAWYSLTTCYLQMQQSAKAQNAIDTALRLKPENPQYLALKGSVDVKGGNVAAGIDSTRRAAQLAPKSVRILSMLANLLLQQHRNEADLDLAEETIGHLEQLDPDLPQLPYERGELERLRQHWPQAARFLERALVVTPGQDEVYFSLGQVYRRLNRAQDADRMMQTYRRRQSLSQQIDAIRIGLGSHPDDAAAYARLADLQLQQGDRDGALSSAQAGLAIDPHAAALQRWIPLLKASSPSGPGSAP